ncbi:MAG: mandelate racemase/muconate lactonizing enzyme family protein [Ignavibacteria bacterium]|nr:mandelate racemase/muconate lactonizing enzyme family protein [Ignavibacteria bacterium]
MKIKNVELFPISMKPVKVGYRPDDELSKIARVDTIVIRISTDGGIVGYGEAATIRSYFNQTMATMMHWLEAYSPELIGENPVDVLKINRILDTISGERAPGCQPSRAAVEMAIYDIIGKAHNCPVYEVLGGAFRTEFEMLTNLYEDNPEEKAKAAQEFVKQGFRGLKVKIGDNVLMRGFSVENFSKGKEKLVAALEAVPDDIYIDADANQCWSNAKMVVQIFEDVLHEKFYPNLSVEQPLHHLDISGHSYLRNALKIPIILDESVVSPEAMFQIAKGDAADRIVLKINRVGGFTKARKIIDICEAASIGISLDTMPFTKLGDTAMCHLGATIRDPYPVDAEGHLWFETTPFSGGIELRNGRVYLPKTPGLGVELDEAELKKLMISPRSP